jgi:hypothetical protein
MSDYINADCKMVPNYNYINNERADLKLNAIPNLKIGE